MDRDPPNPYVDIALRGLSHAMGERAGNLLADRRVGRRDTAYLLIAAARKLAPMTSHPNSPVNQVKQGGTAKAAFLPVYKDEARHMRYRVLIHANDTLCSHHGVERLVDHPRLDALIAMAIADEDGLREALELLDQAATSLRI